MIEAVAVYDHLVPPPIAKEKKVQLVVAWYVNDYKVISITNTTYLRPGMWLKPSAVEQACQFAGWEVTVVDNDLIKMVFGDMADAVKAEVP